MKATIVFSDKTPPYEFDADTTNLGIILKTAKERGWKILAIKTEDYVLSVLAPEQYEEAMTAFNLSCIPPQNV